MLIDVQYLGHTKKLCVSYVDKTGKIKLKYFDWEKPVKYTKCDASDKDRNPKYKSWDGFPVKQIEVSTPDRYAIYEFMDSLPQKEQDEIFEYNLPDIYFIDIETEITDDGFPDAETAPTRVLSISIVYEDKIILLGLRDMSKEMQTRIIDKTNKYFEKFGRKFQFKYIKYEDEFDMLYQFFEKMVVNMPCITGWNFINYDWQYLVNRTRKLKKTVNGTEYTIDPAKSSPTKRLNKVWMTNYELPLHRMIFDYMQLYEICDTTIKVKESSSLDFVSKKLVGVDKIKYVSSIYKLIKEDVIKDEVFEKDSILKLDEMTGNYILTGDTKVIEVSKKDFEKIKGKFREVNVTSLQKLYDEDFETFMYYNCVDSVLVQKIHESKNYISIVYAISSLSRIKISDVVSQLNNALASLAITEGVLRGRFREMDNIVLFRDETKSNGENEGIAGGWVKDPQVGMNKWVVCYDFASLYPTTQRQFYITPETFVGVSSDSDPEYCVNNGVRIKIDKEKHVRCVNGVVFEKRYSPTINMLEEVYADRKTNKKIMMAKKDELKKVLDEIKELEKELRDDDF